MYLVGCSGLAVWQAGRVSWPDGPTSASRHQVSPSIEFYWTKTFNYQLLWIYRLPFQWLTTWVPIIRCFVSHQLVLLLLFKAFKTCKFFYQQCRALNFVVNGIVSQSVYEQESRILARSQIIWTRHRITALPQYHICLYPSHFLNTKKKKEITGTDEE